MANFAKSGLRSTVYTEDRIVRTWPQFAQGSVSTTALQFFLVGGLGRRHDPGCRTSRKCLPLIFNNGSLGMPSQPVSAKKLNACFWVLFALTNRLVSLLLPSWPALLLSLASVRKTYARLGLRVSREKHRLLRGQPMHVITHDATPIEQFRNVGVDEVECAFAIDRR